MVPDMVASDLDLEDLEVARRYLERFGYGQQLDRDTSGERTLEALVRFQSYRGLTVGGLTLETLRAMANPRCGLGEIFTAGSSATRAKPPPCAWKGRKVINVKFDGTELFRDAFGAVRAAMTTWNDELQQLGSKLRMAEVTNNPDVVVAWVQQGADQDLQGGMGGVVIAHADYPPRCSQLGGNPLPLHFDLEEKWSSNQVANTFDVETVALHEFGHLLGLVHAAHGTVMYADFAMRVSRQTVTNADRTALANLY